LLNPILLDGLSETLCPILRQENKSGFPQKSYRLVVIFVLCERELRRKKAVAKTLEKIIDCKNLIPLGVLKLEGFLGFAYNCF
jgi:hypothetical protein